MARVIKHARTLGLFSYKHGGFQINNPLDTTPLKVAAEDDFDFDESGEMKRDPSRGNIMSYEEYQQYLAKEREFKEDEDEEEGAEAGHA